MLSPRERLSIRQLVTPSFRLAIADYAELLVLGALLRRIQPVAPELQILVRRPERIFVPP